MAQTSTLEIFVQRLKVECDLSKSDVETLLGCSHQGKADHLPIVHILKLLNHLNVSLECVFAGRVDYNVIRQRLKQKGSILAQRYRDGVQTSSRFTSAYMVDYLVKTKGEVAKQALFQHFQFDDSHIKDFSLKNNILLPRDISLYVEKYYGEDEVEAMGAHSIELLKDSLAQFHLHENRNWREYVLQFVEDVTHRQVERNYTWDVAGMTPQAVFIRGRPTAEFSQNFPELVKDSATLERLRLGYIRGFVRNYDHGDYEVTQVQSISAGHKYDLYQVTQLRAGVATPASPTVH